MYIAVKKCTFDKVYEKGELIPDNTIEPKMVKKLMQCGIINKTADSISEDEKLEVSKKIAKSKSKS